MEPIQIGLGIAALVLVVLQTLHNGRQERLHDLTIKAMQEVGEFMDEVDSRLEQLEEEKTDD